METDFQEKYDSVMKDKLQELRDQFEEEAENIRQDVENSYKLKVINRPIYLNALASCILFKNRFTHKSINQALLQAK